MCLAQSTRGSVKQMIDRVWIALGEGAKRQRERDRERGRQIDRSTARQTGYEESLEVISCYSENDCTELANTRPLNLKLLLPSVDSVSH